jgi:hypothetical protein
MGGKQAWGACSGGRSLPAGGQVMGWPQIFLVAAIPSSMNGSSAGTNALYERGTSSLDRRRGELEGGAGGDRDLPYSFALPPSIPQVLAWMRLLAKVQRGELQP